MSKQPDIFQGPPWRVFRFRKPGDDDWSRMSGPGLTEDNLFEHFNRPDVPVVYECQEIDDVMNDNPIGEVFLWKNEAAKRQEK